MPRRVGCQQRDGVKDQRPHPAALFGVVSQRFDAAIGVGVRQQLGHIAATALEGADVQHTIVPGQQGAAAMVARPTEEVTGPEISDTETMIEDRIVAVQQWTPRQSLWRSSGRPKALSGPLPFTWCRGLTS
jgi:hypothetical protein